MATEDEHRLYVLLTMIRFDHDATRTQLLELLPERKLELKQALADYRDGHGKPKQYRWARLAEYATEVFAGAGSEVDIALGRWVSPGPGTGDAEADDVGKRWRADLLDTAWRIVVADRMADTPLPG